MKSDRRYWVTVMLVVLLGYLGAHRFYAGKWISGLILAVTFGGFGVGWITDIFLVTLGQLTDVNGYPIRRKPPAPRPSDIDSSDGG